MKATKADFDEQQQFLNHIEETITDIHESVNSMRSAKDQLKKYSKLLKEEKKAAALVTLADSLISQITTWEENLIQPKQKTFQDVINFNNQLNAELMYLKGFADTADPKLTDGAKQRLTDLLADWKKYTAVRDQIINTDMANFNKQFEELKIPAIILKNKP